MYIFIYYQFSSDTQTPRRYQPARDAKVQNAKVQVTGTAADSAEEKSCCRVAAYRTIAATPLCAANTVL